MKQFQRIYVERLKVGFQGEVLLPGEDAYEAARTIWNAMIDKRPAVIVRLELRPPCPGEAHLRPGQPVSREPEYKPS